MPLWVAIHHPQEQAAIADSVKNMLYIASLDNYLMGLKSLVRKDRPHPVIAARTQLAAHLRENLKTLGLKRVSRALTLQEILAQESGNGAADHSDNDDGTGTPTNGQDSVEQSQPKAPVIIFTFGENGKADEP